MAEDRKEVETILTPEGRLINENLFEKDKFNEEAKPSYKIEMAFDPADLNDLEEKLAQAAVDKWGKGAYDDYYDNIIISPVLDGDQMARRREEKDKEGDAYKGKLVIRAHTIFNKHGQDAPGGVMVYGPEVEEIGPAQRQEVYTGCYGQAALTVGTYIESRSGDHALMFYLGAFQKTQDGDRLMSARDYSKTFKPVGRAEGEGTKRRRARG